MSEKVRRIIIVVAAAVFTVAVLLLIIINSGLVTPRWGYLFRPEPTLSRNLGTPKQTAAREPCATTRGRDSLGESLREVYDALEEQLSQEYADVFNADCSIESFRRVYAACRADHPEIFWMDAQTPYSYWDYGDACDVQLHYSFEGDDLAEMRDKLRAAADNALADAPKTASDYELELYFNDYLVKSVDYDTEANLKGTAYGALVYGRAVCAGYAKAFQYLCCRAGVECVSVVGDIIQTDEETELETTHHEWNGVSIEGDWYYVDVTWNDSGNSAFAHAFFNITADALSLTHSVAPCFGDTEEDYDIRNTFVPDCTATAYNYYNKTGVVITDPEDDNDIIAAFLAASRSGSPFVEFRVSEQLDFAEFRQQVTDTYGYRWIEATNHYNHDDPHLLPCSFESYTRQRIINFQLEYQSKI